MIEIIASATIGGIVGFGVCAALTAGKVAENDEDWHDFAAEHADRALETEKAHSRASDALSVLQGKRDEILSIIEGNKTVRTSRIRKVLGHD